MSSIPNNLKYTKEHEWALLGNDSIVTIGITDFAQSSLGDIVYVELPEVGKKLNQDDVFGVVESIKSVSDLYSPISGEVLEVNENLTDSPEALNELPYESWLIKLKVTDDSEFNTLMNNEAYKSHCDGN